VGDDVHVVAARGKQAQRRLEVAHVDRAPHHEQDGHRAMNLNCASCTGASCSGRVKRPYQTRNSPAVFSTVTFSCSRMPCPVSTFVTGSANALLTSTSIERSEG